MKIMCFGTFDLLHKGHIHYLKESKKLGEHLTVVVARDENVKKIKNKTPIENQILRILNLRKLDFINEVILGSKIDFFKVIKENNPDIIALGYDQKAPLQKLKSEFANIKIQRIKPYKPHIYKSSIICNTLKKV